MSSFNTQDLVNRILRALRMTQNSGTATEGEYEAYIVQILDQVKSEYEGDFDWLALRNDVTITLAAAQSEYALELAGDADVDVTQLSRLMYESVSSTGQIIETSRPDLRYQRPQMWDVTSPTNADRKIQVSREAIETLHTQDTNQQQEPSHFAIYPNASGFLSMKVWPTSDAAYTWKGRFVIPQAELDSLDFDGTADAALIRIPATPVWTEALYRLSEERGDLSRPAGSYKREALMELERAVARELGPTIDELHVV